MGEGTSRRVSPGVQREILNIEEAAALLGVSVKTFNKVLQTEDIPARKIGREWKFSKQALIDWVGNGRSSKYRRDQGDRPASRSEPSGSGGDGVGRRTAGWKIELD